MLFLDGVYEVDYEGNTVKFHAIEMPTPGEMQRLLHRISERMARLLERKGYLERDSEEGSLLLDGFDDDVINHLQGSSITYRIGKHRAAVTGEAKKQPLSTATGSSLDCEEGRGNMSWAMRLKRVFNIDITIFRHCQGLVRVIACIEDRQVINQILSHINRQREPLVSVIVSSGIRAPPNNTIP